MSTHLHACDERNGLEPAALVDLFQEFPPEGFVAWRNSTGTPGFTAPFNLLTTVPELRQRVADWPGGRRLERWLTWNTAFIGSTLSEFARVPAQVSPRELASSFARGEGQHHTMSIIKDIPDDCPLLSEQENQWSQRLLQACVDHRYVIVDGFALAYVPIDFTCEDDYLQRMSKSRRKNIKRKLKSREAVEIVHRASGDPYFQCPERVDEYYAMYLAVYDRSDLHFDRLTRPFFEALLTRKIPGSLIVEYHHQGVLAAFNICFMHGGNLIDKYVGFKYPLARELNLYFVSWMVNLEIALSTGCKYFIAGCACPEIKASLGATFTMTRHAVYSRHAAMRAFFRRFGGAFEMDREWHAQPPALPPPNTTTPNVSHHY